MLLDIVSRHLPPASVKTRPAVSWFAQAKLQRKAHALYAEAEPAPNDSEALDAFKALFDQGLDPAALFALSVGAGIFGAGDPLFYRAVVDSRVDWAQAMWDEGTRPYGGDPLLRSLLHTQAALHSDGPTMSFLIQCDPEPIFLSGRTMFVDAAGADHEVIGDSLCLAVMAGNLPAAEALASAIRAMAALDKPEAHIEASSLEQLARASLANASEQARALHMAHPANPKMSAILALFPYPADPPPLAVPPLIASDATTTPPSPDPLETPAMLLARIEAMQSQIDVFSRAAQPASPAPTATPSRPQRTPPLTFGDKRRGRG